MKDMKYKFIYFSCIDKLNTRKIYGECILFFDSKLLYNRIFYISTVHSQYPNKLSDKITFMLPSVKY